MDGKDQSVLSDCGGSKSQSVVSYVLPSFVLHTFVLPSSFLSIICPTTR